MNRLRNIDDARNAVIPLHPIGLGAVLSRSLLLVRHTPGVLLLLLLLLVGILMAVDAFSYQLALISTEASWGQVFAYETPLPSSERRASEQLMLSIGCMLASAMISAPTGVLTQGLAAATLRQIRDGESPRPARVLEQVRPVVVQIAYFSVFGTVLIGAGLVLIPVLGVVLGSLVSSNSVSPEQFLIAATFGVIGMLSLLIPIAWAAVRLSLVPAVLVFEGRSALRAMRRSWGLTRGHFWALFCAGTIVAGIAALAQILLEEFTFEGTSVLVQILVAGVGAVGAVIWSNATGVFYLDALRRAEDGALANQDE